MGGEESRNTETQSDESSSKSLRGAKGLRNTKVRKHFMRAIKVVIALVLVALVASFVYMSIPLAATSEATAVMESSAQTVFTPAGKSESDHYEYGLVFYPGAKVEPAAYAPLMQKLADRGWLCILVDAPWHFALMNINAADQPISSHPQVDHWYVGGHSLGGMVAARYAAEHADALSGLVLCAAYNDVDLSNTNLDIVSIHGSEDGVLRMDNSENSYKLVPDTFRELVIPGGNHAQFGNYGDQLGDNSATISPEEQQTIAADFIVAGRES